MGISGAFAAVPTPVDRAGDFEQRALRSHLAFLAEAGLDGAVVLGTNGEFPSFTLDERRRIAAAAAEADSGLRLILGVGSCALGDVLEMVEEAARTGYQAVLCPPPFYYRAPAVGGLAEFFTRVLEAAPIPVLLYHIPQITGVPIDDALLDLVGDHDRMAGVKDSSGDPAEMDRLIRRLGRRSYLVGSDRLVHACRQAGGSGSITAAASVAPKVVAGAAASGPAQQLLSQLRDLLEEYGLGAAVKALLRQMKFGSYGSRPPLVGLDGDAVRSAELERRFEALMQLTPEPR